MTPASAQTNKLATCRVNSDIIAAKEAPKPRQDRLVDAAVEDTFPASDPPAYMGGTATGAPSHTNRAGSCASGEAGDDKGISPATSSTRP
jgi:hypothetical protein